MGAMDTGTTVQLFPLVLLLLIVPLVACVWLNARATAAVSCATAALAMTTGIGHGVLSHGDFLVRLGGLLLGSAISVYAAHRRTTLEAALGAAREVARITQRVILRPISRNLAGTHVCTRYHSAAPESSIGGDLYDVAVTPYGLRVLVGDVRGHDLTALRLTAETLTAFRELAYTTPDLPKLATALDGRLTPELGPEDFVTAVLAEFVPGEVRLVNCGHPAPLRSGRRVELLEPLAPTTPLGLHPEPRLQRALLQPGDRLLLYTDGLTETRAPDGTPLPLLPVAARALSEPLPEEVLAHLCSSAHAHAGSHPVDDLALVLCQPTEAAVRVPMVT
ncbi:PP2C family protein-serine/threonine phosphatase [Streptomyces coacervatus]|uniref:PP2C family protein-serine/threonine phosphatase n=1 Tax=Streptomyces coacervatus TaxID=647381 RepID=A0ABP7IL24_9ACTN|nr:PP2C family protein-serine/threonine phosphatase [Streptomyces coacervatus]MDF2268870.1 PP2C family protein-serine/threonine phosphatase [Streptomyces coacervatus]